jgi:putative membrane protein
MKNINTSWLTISVLAISLVLLGSCQQSPQSVQAAREAPGVTNENPANTGHDALLNKGDREFMRRAEDFDLQQRNLSRFILQRSQNADVRNYAKMLVDDHTKDLHNAVALMEDKGIRQPTNMPEVKHEALTELSKLSGLALDRAFIETVVKDHEKAIAEYTKEEQSGEDPAVRDYAARSLLTLQQHLQKAQELQGKLTQ